MLTLAEGQAGVFVRVLFRLRLFVLILLVAAIGVSIPLLPWTWLQIDHAASTAGSIILSAILIYYYLRHVRLTLLVIVAPLGGLIIAQSLGEFLRPEYSILGFILGITSGLFIADALTSTVAGGLHRGDAARAAFAASIPPILASCLFTLSPGLLYLLPDAAWLPALSVVALLIAPMLVALLIVPMAGSFLRYGENFLETTTRLTEHRQRFSETLTVLAEPRWSLSLSGIVIVFAVLFLFTGSGIDLMRNWHIVAAGAALLCVSAILAARRWRATFALILSSLVCLLAGVAIAARLSLAAWSMLDILTAALSLAFLVSAIVAWRFFLGERDGDEPEAARIRAMTRLAPPLILSFLLSSGITMLWFGQMNIVVILAVILAGHLAALFFMAALSGSLETLIPRRRSLESLYRG